VRDREINERGIISFRLKFDKILRIDIRGVGSLLVESRDRLSVFRCFLPGL
jgi:hypothetical protein